jgi:hypothetical protein
VPGARALLVAEAGARIYVATRDGEVFAILDPERDGTADEVVAVAGGLTAPVGLALGPDGALLIAEQHRILELAGAGRAQVVVPPGVLPARGRRGSRHAGIGPDGRLYVAVGASCDACEVRGFEGTIVRLRPDGHELEIFARGVRDAVGFDWHPLTGELFFVDGGGDADDPGAPDELNRAAEPGLHFGFPYVYGDGTPDPQFAGRAAPQPTTSPALAFDPRAGTLGIDFYGGRMFPADYRNDALVAQHGAGASHIIDSAAQLAGVLRLTKQVQDGLLVDPQPVERGLLLHRGHGLSICGDLPFERRQLLTAPVGIRRVADGRQAGEIQVAKLKADLIDHPPERQGIVDMFFPVVDEHLRSEKGFCAELAGIQQVEQAQPQLAPLVAGVEIIQHTAEDQAIEGVAIGRLWRVPMADRERHLPEHIQRE